MTLLIVNSNTTPAITDLLRTEAQRVVRPGTGITALTAAHGPAAIETPQDVDAAARATEEAICGHDGPVDAAVIACFSDPGLAAIRRRCAFPVVGLAEAAMFAACMLGARFSIVTVSPPSVPGILSLARAYGLSQRLSGVHALDRGVLQGHRDPEGTLGQLGDLAARSLATDGSDVIVLGGAITAGMARRIAPRLDRPVVDCLAAAVLMAEALAPSWQQGRGSRARS
ncbi:aspartate/glutamate racemase family protein [Anianabacter salinae]|uniref:aspartate/glutamate racemase family protein n=1 Tax=Anianabacter salinae TaxID=2851023 RepID=UPI00225E5B89|nr:aspartate/glutamate racemase family protein [Anianabacter salinae]MBV0914265.1 hypothetical protein [Anianabacter salinae]